MGRDDAKCFWFLGAGSIPSFDQWSKDWVSLVMRNTTHVSISKSRRS